MCSLRHFCFGFSFLPLKLLHLCTLYAKEVHLSAFKGFFPVTANIKRTGWKNKQKKNKSEPDGSNVTSHFGWVSTKIIITANFRRCKRKDGAPSERLEDCSSGDSISGNVSSLDILQFVSYHGPSCNIFFFFYSFIIIWQQRRQEM